MKSSPQAGKLFEAFRKAALGHAGVEESLACKGTAIESASFKVRGKSFLFLRPATAMLKLESSKAQAQSLATRSPHACKVGASGWTTLTFSEPAAVNLKLAEKWVAESYNLFSSPKATKSSNVKKRARRP